MPNRDSLTPIQDKAIRLFSYLQELVQLRTPQVRDIESYEAVLWFSEIPHEDGCYSISWAAPLEDTDVWAEVKKRREPLCPGIPENCREWVDPSGLHQSDAEPRLKERIPAPIDESENNEVVTNPPSEAGSPSPVWSMLDDCPQVKSSWARYTTEKWRPWAEKHRKWKAVQSIYGRLFTILQLQKGLAESYEFMIGLGLLCWITPAGQRVRRHILAGQANLEFDSNTGTLSVRPAADGVKLGFEMEMLDPDERPQADQQIALEKALEQTAETPWDRGCVDPILRSWVNALSSEGIYEAAEEKPESLDPHPRLVFAPAVFLRRRTGRSLVHAFRSVIDQIKKGEEVPLGVRRLLEVEEGVREQPGGVSGDESSGREEGSEPICFPLPANDEQRRIVERMSRDQGVLVQGPPGTGKSHTIANLICHELAMGKRILVTSQTPRALKVLQGKIPKELLPLCVSVLGNDRESLRTLEDSVHGITDQFHRWNPRGNETEIKRLGGEMYELQKRRAAIDSLLKEQRERDTYTFSVADGAYRGTAQAIARQVFDQITLFDWFSDQITPKCGLPLSQNEFRRLRDSFLVLNSLRMMELNHKVPALEELPSIEEFVKLVDNEKKAASRCEQHSEARLSAWYSPAMRADPQCRESACRSLRELAAAVGTVLRRPGNWVPKAVSSFLADQDRPLRELRKGSCVHLKGLAERARAAQSLTIELAPNLDRRKLRADATDLHAHLTQGGTLGWGPFRKDVVKRALYVTTSARVNGRACETPEVIEQLLLRFEVESTISLLWDLWQGRSEKILGPLPRQVSELEELQEVLDSVLALESKLQDAKKAVTVLGGLPEPKWHDPSSTGELMVALEVALADYEHFQCRQNIENYSMFLESLAAHPDAHPVVHRALEALRNRTAKEWGIVLNDIEKLKQDRELRTWQFGAEKQVANVAPKLAHTLKNSAEDSAWEQRLSRIEQAWNWARADSWLREYEREHDLHALETERQQVEKALAGKIAALAAAKSWRHCFARMTEEHRTYLEAWRKEVQRIGKGTGKYAERHRRTAQKYMNQCRDAIPAWIMPFYRVAETIQPRKHCFDLVIIDEASQSGPDALLLQYLAKQIVIVGDDQQISPEDVGVDQTQVHALQLRYLYDFGLKETFGTGYSLFAQAEIRYGNRIPLREHFRCMPEIIRFSNDLCYSANPLVPLRQYPPKRLDPIVVCHVATGFREGGAQSARNLPEAEALVEAICKCCTDPTYQGKTMGVISLQGDYQAGLIQRLLKDRLGEQEMIRREIVCGDAYAFQGDERDVIFMSMVAAPNERIGALTKETDKRRFNVAASRPRDQVWLFHTASVNDLNQEDMRCKLLSYYQNPGQSPLGTPDWNRCESQFEEQVGKQIYTKGYRVVLQFEPLGRGGKRIDIVVEGKNTRIAIECDGDRWHGPEEYEKDMFRQRQLERAGLVFWRIRGSDYYRNPEKALQPLWKVLYEMDIETWDATPKENVAVAPVRIANPSITHAIQPLLIDKPAPANLFSQKAEPSANIREVPKDQLRSALHSCIPDNGPISRNDLLHEVARKLGYSKVGRNIRSAINRTIGAEVRAGRLKTDWQNVWKPENSQPAE